MRCWWVLSCLFQVLHLSCFVRCYFSPQFNVHAVHVCIQYLQHTSASGGSYNISFCSCVTQANNHTLIWPPFVFCGIWVNRLGWAWRKLDSLVTEPFCVYLDFLWCEWWLLRIIVLLEDSTTTRFGFLSQSAVDLTWASSLWYCVS